MDGLFIALSHKIFFVTKQKQTQARNHHRRKNENVSHQIHHLHLCRFDAISCLGSRRCRPSSRPSNPSKFFDNSRPTTPNETQLTITSTISLFRNLVFSSGVTVTTNVPSTRTASRTNGAITAFMIAHATMDTTNRSMKTNVSRSNTRRLFLHQSSHMFLHQSSHLFQAALPVLSIRMANLLAAATNRSMTANARMVTSKIKANV